MSAFGDGDFSFSIRNTRRDEVGDLVDAHNELGRVLREQRQNLFQRELLLDTVVQNTPNALVLVEPGGHVVYANLAARALLNGGRAMNGIARRPIIAEAPPELAEALSGAEDALFSVQIKQEDETFHLSQRNFKLQGRTHRMIMLRRMTRELSRQEVATWKKVIRVVSHELNNSLAPIRSLSHSGRELARRGELERLATRVRHDRGARAASGRFRPGLCAFRQVADAATGLRSNGSRSSPRSGSIRSSAWSARRREHRPGSIARRSNRC